MLKESDIIKLILGLKIQQLRKEQDLSYQQLSDKTGLAISYLHNIEKGKKYPKGDKILALAKALNTDYNYLVSLDAGRKLQPIIDLLRSDFLKIFPLDLFGINTAKLIELLSQTPIKVNAFVNTIIKIIRNYHLSGEDFNRAALRSYQDLYHNYFEDLEVAVRQFKQQNSLDHSSAITTQLLEHLLSKKYGISVNREQLHRQKALQKIRSYYAKEQACLFIASGLTSAQENLLLAKEVGFQFLAIQERPYETRMIAIEAFDQLLNNFRASYFAVALLLDEKAMIDEVKKMAQWKKWQERQFLGLLEKYNVTSEMLLQRLANILPKHFGINDLFFLRFFTDQHLSKFEMTKEMHLSQLHNPQVTQVDEHYCRRWISISLIRKLKTRQGIENFTGPIVGAQISKYWKTPNDYLVIALAKADNDNPEHSTCVSIGLLITDQLKRTIRWLNHPEVPIKEVHTACESCGIHDCEARAAAPIVLQQERNKEEIRKALEEMNG